MTPEESARVKTIVESMKVVIELVKFFREKHIDPTVALIAMGKFVAIHHGMHPEPIGTKLNEEFIRALRQEYSEVRQLKELVLDSTDKSRKVQ